MKIYTSGIKPGDKVKCRFNELEGIVTAIVVYLNGHVQCCVTPEIDSNGKHIEGMYFNSAQFKLMNSKCTHIDATELELIEKNAVHNGSDAARLKAREAGDPPASYRWLTWNQS